MQPATFTTPATPTTTATQAEPYAGRLRTAEPGLPSPTPPPGAHAPGVVRPQSPGPRPPKREMTACAECGRPAEVLDRFALPSTHGPVEHVRLRCLGGQHHLLMPADRAPTPVPADPEPTPGRTTSERNRP